MKKLLFLYNTHAGKGLLKSRLAAVQDALAAAGWDVTIHPTQGAGDATLNHSDYDTSASKSHYRLL